MFIYCFLIIVYIECLFIVFLIITVYSRNCVEDVRYYLNVNPTIEWVLWGVGISLRRLIDQHGPTGIKSSGRFKAQSPQRFLNRKSFFDVQIPRLTSDHQPFVGMPLRLPASRWPIFRHANFAVRNPM